MFKYFHNWLIKKRTREKTEKFLSKYKTKDVVVNIGCGNSTYDEYFSSQIKTDIIVKNNVDIVCSAYALPFKNNTFKVILMTEVLEHLKKPAKVIEEIRRTMKQKGILIVTTRFIFPLHDTPIDYYRYTKYGLEYLFRDFHIKELCAESTTIETFSILLQRLFYQCKFKYCDKLIKIICLLCSKLILLFKNSIKEEFTSTTNSVIKNEKEILTSGYYIVLEKL